MGMPINSARASIAHARDLIADLEAQLARFKRSQNAFQVVHHEPILKQQIYRIRFFGPEFPQKASNIAKDAVSNLRDSLDHIMYAAAVAKGGGTPKKTGFPFGSDADAVRHRLTRELADNPRELHQLLLDTKPYEGGNHAIWSLNQLRNPNTHRFIVPVGSAAVAQATVTEGVILGPSVFYNRWHSATNEVEYMRLGSGSTIQLSVSAHIQVQFADVEAVAGRPVIPTLLTMASEVDRIVTSIEDECCRLGFAIS